MGGRTYYNRDDGTENDYCRSDLPLLVNCSGMAEMKEKFTTNRLRHDYYIMYITEGRLAMTLDGRKYEVGPGKLAVFPPDVPMYYSMIGTERVVYFWAHFTGSAAAGLVTACGFGGFGIYDIKNGGILISGFRRIFDDFLFRDGFTEASAAAELAALMIAAGRQADGMSGAVERVLGTSLRYIHSEFCKKIDVKTLADAEHMSVSRYNAVFRSCMGEPPMRYVISLRIQNARELLIKTDLSVKQIAASVGYCDQHYFSRLFCLYAGQSPAAFRKSRTAGNK